MKPRIVLVVAAALLAACGSPDAQTVRPPGSVVSASVSESRTADLASSVSASAAGEASGVSVPGNPPPEQTASAPVPAVIDQTAQLGVAAVVPWGTVTDQDIAHAVALVATLTVQQKAGAVIMASSADAVGSNQVADLQLGGVILMGSQGVLDGTSSGTPGQVAAVTQALIDQVAPSYAGFPLLIATDQEYGDVTRLQNGFTSLPSAAQLGAIGNLDAAISATQQAGAVAGSEMAAVGINIDFAPVSDLLPLSGSSAMTGRSYGSDPDRAAALVTAAVAGYQSAGIVATLKHFPGIGELGQDTHVALPTLSADCATWNARASVPIRAGVAAGAGLVMTGHTIFPVVDDSTAPTSMSAQINLLLRSDPTAVVGLGCEGIGFHGVSVTDSLQMAPILNNYSAGDAGWQALAAGHDLVLMPQSPTRAVQGIQDAVVTGQLSEARLNEAAVRVFALRSSLSRLQKPALDTVGSDANGAIAADVWAQIP